MPEQLGGGWQGGQRSREEERSQIPCSKAATIILLIRR